MAANSAFRNQQIAPGIYLLYKCGFNGFSSIGRNGVVTVDMMNKLFDKMRIAAIILTR